MTTLTDQHFAGLLSFRSGISHFEHASDQQARALGLTHVQHHILLAIRAHPVQERPMIADLARALAIHSHSAAELVARVTRAGLIRRLSDPSDARVARLELTDEGHARLVQLAEPHLGQLRDLAAHGVKVLAD